MAAESSLPESDSRLSESELQQEREHFLKIVNAFLYYKWVQHFSARLSGKWAGLVLDPLTVQDICCV